MISGFLLSAVLLEEIFNWTDCFQELKLVLRQKHALYHSFCSKNYAVSGTLAFTTVCQSDFKILTEQSYAGDTLLHVCLMSAVAEEH